MRNYVSINESENPLDPVLSNVFNGKSEDEVQELLKSELHSIGVIDKTICNTPDDYVDYIMNHCVEKDIFLDFISSKEVAEKKDQKTGKVESGYYFYIFEVCYMGRDNKTIEETSIGMQIDDDVDTFSLSTYFY